MNAPATTAAPAASPETPKEEVPVIGTTAKLFPELAQPADKPNPPAAPNKVDTPPVAAKADAPKPPEPDYLDIEAFGTKKVKVKVDGQEAEVLLSDVVRGYQTDRHLTQKGQKLAEERKKWEQERTAAAPPKPAEPAVNKPGDDVKDPELQKVLEPFLKPYQEQIKTLVKELETLKPALQPIQLEQNLEKEDNYWKERGVPGFKEVFKSGELKKLAIELKPDAFWEYDNPEGVKELFTIYMARQAKAKATPQGTPTPAKPEDKGNKAPEVPDVEPGSGAPSVSEDASSEVKEALKQYKANPNRDTLAEYFLQLDKAKKGAGK